MSPAPTKQATQFMMCLDVILRTGMALLYAVTHIGSSESSRSERFLTLFFLLISLNIPSAQVGHVGVILIGK